MAKLKSKSSNAKKSGSVKAKSTKSRYKIGKFRRYTNLAALIHLLQNKRITLLNPASWDDKNDAHFMAEYKRLRDMETVLAICFAEAAETYHHWRVFSHGADGVCISFDRKSLLRAFSEKDGITMNKVRYELVETVADWDELKISELPFLKRKPYEPEQEFRVIYEQKRKQHQSFDMPIELNWIETITLSPWMPPAFQSAVTETLKAIKGCDEIKIVRSTLIGRGSWQELAARAVP